MNDSTRAGDGKKLSPFLDTAQAAFYIGLSKRTLEDMRRHGAGPKFRRHGRRVRYHIDDLAAWSEARATAPLHAPGHAD